MDDEAVKAMRLALRHVQEHLTQAHLRLGAERESVGLVNVIHHPKNNAPYLNYVTPRKSTAWVSGKDVEKGLQRLRDLERMPRVQYIEGLFLPIFSKTLRDLELRVEQETPLMLYRPDAPIQPPARIDGVTVVQANDLRGVEMWWYVWRNAYFDVLTLGVEPLLVGQDMREITLGRQIDILVYHFGSPVGVARVTVHQETAHIAAFAIMKELRDDPQIARVLQTAAVQAAVERKCALIFAPGDTEQDRRLWRDLGFVDSGSLVCYSERPEEARGKTHDDTLAEPVLVLR